MFIPHLQSLPLGYASVQKELRRLRDQQWYDFYADPPFWPAYFNGQGAVPRSLEKHRFRRSTEGGGPRKPVYDASGLQAISINEAARTYHMPAHFWRDMRPAMKQWL